MGTRAHGTDSSTKISVTTPAFRMPAEWEPHAATWLAWPHYHGDWPGKFEPIPWVYAEIIRHLSRHERVELIINDAASEKFARKILDKANALERQCSFSPLADESGVDEGFGVHIRCAELRTAGQSGAAVPT